MLSPDKNFIWVNRGPLKVLTFLPWWEQGIDHGFIGACLRFDEQSLAANAREVCQMTGAETLQLVAQVHGTELMSAEPIAESAQARPEEASADSYRVLGQGDGLIVSSGGDRVLRKRVFGIRTADCLPVLMRSGPYWGLVHAGWRGLSSGIVEQALRRLKNLSAGDLTEAPAGGGAAADTRGEGGFGARTQAEVVIGPAAGSARYEVGIEVIEAFHGRAVASPAANLVANPGTSMQPHGKYLLDLAATCRNIAEGEGARVFSANVCTMADSGWHSHRREGARAGRNLAFIAP
jgi:copper oxidase (laccase) domain-containing protein